MPADRGKCLVRLVGGASDVRGWRDHRDDGHAGRIADLRDGIRIKRVRHRDLEAIVRDLHRDRLMGARDRLGIRAIASSAGASRRRSENGTFRWIDSTRASSRSSTAPSSTRSAPSRFPEADCSATPRRPDSARSAAGRPGAPRGACPFPLHAVRAPWAVPEPALARAASGRTPPPPRVVCRPFFARNPVPSTAHRHLGKGLGSGESPVRAIALFRNPIYEG